jgi:biopolymer transport protein ExbB
MNWISHHIAAHAAALRAGDLVQLGVLIAADVLIAFSLASVAVMIERALNLSRARRAEETEYSALRQTLLRDGAEATRSRIAAGEAPSAAAVQNGLDLHTNNRELFREAIGQGIEVQNAVLNRNLSILATVASTAPYVGLFGTVLGILSAFAKIARTGQTGASVVAAPIAEALTATAMGLGVAIPAVMAYNYFSGRVGDLMLRVETHALDLAARLTDADENDDAFVPAGVDSHAR